MDPKHKSYIERWTPVLETFLAPLDISEKMLPSFRREFHELRLVDRRFLSHEFLNKLLESQDEDIFETFKDALNSCEDQRWLYELIFGDVSNEDLNAIISHVHNLPDLKRSMDALTPHLHYIDPVAFLQDMKDLFSESEWHKCKATNTMQGKIIALWEILEILPRKDPRWKTRFWNHVNDKKLRQSNGGHGILADALNKLFRLAAISEESNDGQVSEESKMELDEPFTSTEEKLEESVQQPNHAAIVDVVAESKALSNSGELAKKQSGQCSTDLDLHNTGIKAEQGTQFIANQSEKSIELIPLREYQQELLDNTPDSENAIICAPPGCGKTLIAAHIIKKTLEKADGNRSRKFQCRVLFLAPSVALVNQQMEKFSEYLGHKYLVDCIFGNTGEDMNFKFHCSDILCCTPQIVLNAILKKEVEIEDFQLIVFDECHHCNGHDPYNKLMIKYLQQKRSGSRHLPRVIGLTATLGIGKTTSVTTAKANIIQQCASLDAVGGIIIVQRNKAQMARYVASPTERTISLSDKPDNSMVIKLKEIMDEIINCVENLQVYTLFGASPQLKNLAALKKGTFLFDQNCSILERLVQESNEVQKPRDIYSCLEYLQKYNKCLDILLQLEPRNCIDELQQFCDRCEESAGKVENQTEEWLLRQLQNNLKILEWLSQTEECQNVYLEIIEREIAKQFASVEESRVMVMVEERKQTLAIRDWINRNHNLKEFGAEYFVGATKGKVDDIGMDEKKQLVVMDGFRDGLHKILVCTNEASGEGIDVQNCNMVLCYNYSKNEIGLVQQKGRARDKDGKLLKLSTRDVQKRDERNMFKVLVMEEATEGVQRLFQTNRELYMQQLEAHQNRTLAEKRMEAISQPVRTNKEYRMQCRKCRVDVCSSFDVRKVCDDDSIDGALGMNNVKYINVSPEFKSKFETEPHRNVQPMGRDWTKKTKFRCRKCGKAWGIQADWRSLPTLPLMKIDGFRIVDPTNRHFLNAPRQWKSACFVPEFISFEDLVEKLSSDSNQEQ